MDQAAGHRISWKTGSAIVIANMIGSGVFTSLGFQLVELRNTYTIIILWMLGGVIALAGAFSYAEVGTSIRKSGGEYTFLSDIYHPMVGYLGGWISLTVGFAAPIALTAIAFADYFGYTGFASSKGLAIAVLILISVVHSFNLRLSALFQNFSTSLKIGFIVLFLLSGLWLAPVEDSALYFGADWQPEVASAAFAVALIYVSYSYTGWNAAAYIIEEFRQINRDLPRALIWATLVVTLLYTVLQLVMLKHASHGELVGQVEVGAIAANRMFAENISRIFSGAISLLLVSSISAMVWVGPRVSYKMASDFRLWSFLKSVPGRIPVRALWFQTAISVFLILTGTFEQILIYCGILLNLSSALVVAGVFILRRQRKTGSYRSPLYPLWQIMFLLVTLWMLVFAILDKPVEVMLGLINLVIGLITYWFDFKYLRT